MIATNRGLPTVRSSTRMSSQALKNHRPRDDAVFGVRVSAGYFPPQIFAAEPRDRFVRNLIYRHAAQ
jgi:hypothetical protein